MLRTHSSVSNILRISILKDDGSGDGKTGLVFNSTGLIIGTICDNEAAAVAYSTTGATVETIGTLGTYTAPTATKCRFKEVDATNCPGLYELHLADARFAVASAKQLSIVLSGVTGMQRTELQIDLTKFNLYNTAGVLVSSIDDGVITAAKLSADALSAIAGATATNLAARLLS